MCLERSLRGVRQWLALRIDGVVQADHKEARRRDTHGHAHALNCDLAHPFLGRGVHHLAVVVVVSGEDMDHVAHVLDKLNRIDLVKDVLVLISARDTDSVTVIRVHRPLLALGRLRRRPVFAARSARGAGVAIQGDMGEENRREFRGLVADVRMGEPAQVRLVQLLDFMGEVLLGPVPEAQLPLDGSPLDGLDVVKKLMDRAVDWS